MTSRLDTVLDDTELPLAELCAARLDGELVACAGRFIAVDAPDAAEVRAALAHAGRSGRVIVELRSAAWVHGARPVPPSVPQLCVSASARTQRRPLGGLREVRFDDGDLVSLGGVLVTSRLRTVLDLVRAADDPEHEEDQPALLALLEADGHSADDAAAQLDARRKLPGKARALRRLAELERMRTGDGRRQPAETR